MELIEIRKENFLLAVVIERKKWKHNET
jgi:hypothetical protein